MQAIADAQAAEADDAAVHEFAVRDTAEGGSSSQLLQATQAANLATGSQGPGQAPNSATGGGTAAEGVSPHDRHPCHPVEDPAGGLRKHGWDPGGADVAQHEPFTGEVPGHALPAPVLDEVIARRPLLP